MMYSNIGVSFHETVPLKKLLNVPLSQDIVYVEIFVVPKKLQKATKRQVL